MQSELSMLEGDKGYISFSDINFDGFPTWLSLHYLVWPVYS